ncbi:MAG: CoA transferase, partial [Alphaproteobacteria bacterium]
ALDPSVPADRTLLRRVLDAADVVLTSSDLAGPFADAAAGLDDGRRVICDLTAFGSDGPLAGEPHPDALVQALTGLMDTSGFADGPPQGMPAPILEFSAAIYGAAAVLAALRVRGGGGGGQGIEVALYDCAVSMLTTFLAAHFGGGRARRVGNRHPLSAPWNAYRATDGWVLICSTSDAQWQRLCKIMGRADLAADPAFATVNGRAEGVDAVDEVVQDWVGANSVGECVELLSAETVACGPIVPVAGISSDANVIYRGMVRRLVDPEGGEVAVPGTPLRGSAGLAVSPGAVPARDSGRAAVVAWLAAAADEEDGVPAVMTSEPPLAGLRVVEIGHYTTAPLAARMLAMLGADVIKVEPPAGEGSRFWPPHKDGQGYFFTLGNNDKRAMVLDLRGEASREALARLLARSDVLIENLRPGALARQGFSRERLDEINPRLVYCGVSGFGADSLHKDRPAYDTVVQAMSGIMDLMGAGGTPVKTGVSLCDVIGGGVALLSVIAALAQRERTGKGQFLDLSMQDSAAWITQMFWNEGADARPPGVIACADGYVAVTADDAARAGDIAGEGAPDRAALTEKLVAAGIAAAPVRGVAEVVADAQTVARECLVERPTGAGVAWPVMTAPMKFARTPARAETAIGALGADMADILADIGYGPDEARALIDAVMPRENAAD